MSEINTEIVLGAIRAFDLDVSRIHCDTTSIKVYGKYPDGPEGGSRPEDPDAAPVPTYGHSKDKRPDLKQLIFGLTVCSDGFVPLLGRVTDGNRDDNHELAFLAEQLAKAVPDPQEKTLVGDCKLLTGPNLVLLEKYNLNFITLMPRGWKAWDHAYQQARGKLKEAPILRELVEIKEVPKGGEYEIKDEEVREVWRGLSVETTHSWKQKVNGKTVERSAKLRALVVHSSGLEARKRKSLQKASEKEASTLKRLAAKLKKQDFACKHDASSVAEKAKKKVFRFHNLSCAVESAEKNCRGRPKKGEAATTRTIFKVQLTFDWEESLFLEALECESVFVLVTLPKSALQDAEILEGYKNQGGIESNFARLKGPLSVAPIFLEKPERIAALAQVYVIALMVVVARDLRTQVRLPRP